MKAALQGRQVPTRIAGYGEPSTVGRGATQRLFADGGGLCPPGLWPPERRFPTEGLALKLQRAFLYELGRLGDSRADGLVGFLVDLASGRVKDSPCPEEQT